MEMLISVLSILVSTNPIILSYLVILAILMFAAYVISVIVSLKKGTRD